MKIIKLTDPEIQCIYSLVMDRQIEGCYSGNKEQYYKIIDSILRKLECAHNEEIKNDN